MVPTWLAIVVAGFNCLIWYAAYSIGFWHGRRSR